MKLPVMPATNATSERSFSALRRMKSYFRSSESDTTQQSHGTPCPQNLTDGLNLNKVGNEFVGNKEMRISL